MFLVLVGSTFAQPLDNNGWTILTPSSDSRIVYVSSSTGNDTNDGLSSSAPKKTLAAGLTLMRNGFPDWLRLKSGDVWNNDTISWQQSGRSVNEKSVLTSYGTGPRPLIKNGFYKSIGTKNHIAIIGIEFYQSYSDPQSLDYLQGTTLPNAIQIRLDAGGDILVENNSFRYYGTNVQIRRIGGWVGGELLDGVTFRRNINTDAKAFCLTITWADKVNIEENTFDRCGWVNRSKFLHDVYIKEDKHVTARGNSFLHGGNFGLKISGDHQASFTNFVVEDNLFYRGGLSLGHSEGATDYDPKVNFAISDGLVSRNIFVNPYKDFVDDRTEQSGATYNQNFDNVTFDGNIFTHLQVVGGTGTCFGFSGGSERSRNATVTNNVVYDWTSNWFRNSGLYWKGHEDVENFVASNNFPSSATYFDPDRDLASYSVSFFY